MSLPAQDSAAYRAWLDAPFPHGSPIDAVDEVHADLVLIDTWVADTVLPYVKSGQLDWPMVDVLEGIAGLRTTIHELAGSLASARPVLAEYSAYLDLLEAVFRELARRRHR